MRKAIAIVIQVLILVAAWYLIANRIEANTYFGSVSYNVDVIAENIRWIMLTAGILSVVNIWFWWPRTQKVINTPSATPITPIAAEGDKSTEAGEKIDQDPKTPALD